MGRLQFKQCGQINYHSGQREYDPFGESGPQGKGEGVWHLPGSSDTGGETLTGEMLGLHSLAMQPALPAQRFQLQRKSSEVGMCWPVGYRARGNLCPLTLQPRRYQKSYV